jgi:hypothetical protein
MQPMLSGEQNFEISRKSKTNIVNHHTLNISDKERVPDLSENCKNLMKVNLIQQRNTG